VQTGTIQEGKGRMCAGQGSFAGCPVQQFDPSPRAAEIRIELQATLISSLGTRGIAENSTRFCKIKP
jgi:hypothetical protein